MNYRRVSSSDYEKLILWVRENNFDYDSYPSGRGTTDIQFGMSDEAWQLWDGTKKVVILFKTPDALANLNVGDYTYQGILCEKLEKWFEYGEYVRLEFDLINMTAKVLEN